MERILLSTADGSHTISIPNLAVTYHSTHGAIQESKHIFIEAGLDPILQKVKPHYDILEIGFGTGLNTLLTLIAANNASIRYETLEPYPIDMEIFRQLNYCDQMGRQDLTDQFLHLHYAPWHKEITIHPDFTFIKQPFQLSAYSSQRQFDLIYFDAFSPGVQPELWTESTFTKLFSFLKEDGRLVTYCSKSVVRRAMSAAGFLVEKIPGPHGKREMVRAIKPQVH